MSDQARVGSAGIVMTLAGRNLRLYFRDRLNVFFSLLQALILFVLYVLFLANLQVQGIESASPGISDQAVHGFVDTWMFAGIIAVTAMTTPLGALSAIVDDRAAGRFKDFLVSPIRRVDLVAGYLIVGVVVGLIMSLLVMVIGLLYLWIVDGVTLPFGDIAATYGWGALSALMYSAIWSFVLTFLRSPGAVGGLSGGVGTVLAFAAGAYIAIGLFPDAVRHALSALPFAQAAMLVRHDFVASPLDALVGGNAELTSALDTQYGVTLSVGDWSMPMWFAAAELAVVALVFLAFAVWRIRRVIR